MCHASSSSINAEGIERWIKGEKPYYKVHRINAEGIESSLTVHHFKVLIIGVSMQNELKAVRAPHTDVGGARGINAEGIESDVVVQNRLRQVIPVSMQNELKVLMKKPMPCMRLIVSMQNELKAEDGTEQGAIIISGINAEGIESEALLELLNEFAKDVSMQNELKGGRRRRKRGRGDLVSMQNELKDSFPYSTRSS